MENNKTEKKYQLFTVPVGQLSTNCYILMDKKSGQAAVIDPGDNADQLAKKVSEAGGTVSLIINTHGHWDHVGGNSRLRALTGAPICIHELDAEALKRATINMAIFFAGANGDGGTADRMLHEGDTLQLGGLTLQVLHTPGHTPGGISLLCEDLLFAGDTLFLLSCGRVDLPGGNENDMRSSLRRLLQLPGELTVLPGHGAATTIEYERANNPYAK